MDSISVQQEIKNIRMEIAELKNKIRLLEEKESHLEKQLMPINVCYTDINLLPTEMKNLHIYVPNTYYVYHKNISGAKQYIVQYDDYKFSIMDNHGVEDHYPNTFEINGKRPDNPIDSTRSVLVEMYYRYPYQACSSRGIRESEFNDLFAAIEKTKICLYSIWKPEMAFGLAIFHYWVNIYYRGRSFIHTNLYNMFERQPKI